TTATKSTACPPCLGLGLRTRVRRHHSIDDGESVERNPGMERRLCCRVRRCWAFCITHLVSRLRSQLFQQGLRLLEVGGVKALREPAVDWGEQVRGFLALRAGRCWGEGINSGTMAWINHLSLEPGEAPVCVSNFSSSCAAMRVRKRPSPM